MSSFQEKYDKALLGDLRHLPRWHQSAAQEGSRAEELCIRALWWFAGPAPDPEPGVEELLQVEAASPKSAEPLALAASHVARLQMLRLDWAGLEKCIRVLESIDASPLAQNLAGLWRAYRAVLKGEPNQRAAGEALYREAASQGWAMVAVDATTLQGFALMIEGEVDAALGVARRAARMAQTEHQWLPHYFASLLLARLRRFTGNAHLASRIIDACLQVTPTVWHGWLAWEQTLAGATRGGVGTCPGPVGRAAQVLADYVRGSVGYDRAAVEQVLSLTKGSVPHQSDARSLCFALDLSAAPEPGSEMARWLFGEDARPPGHLGGLIAAPTAGESDPSGSVLAVARPGLAGRRIVEFALPKEVEQLPSSPTQRMRVHTLVAALVLAGDQGLAREDLFEQTYGFTYRKDAHEGAFRVLRHYASSYLADYASVESRQGRYFLSANRAFAVVDPRSVRPLKDIMLRHLARAGGASAKDVAEALGVPLRTVQSALREMVGDGACASKREGRRIAYEVEDTTFLPLTVV